VYNNVCLCVCMCLFVCVHMCLCVYVCVYIGAHLNMWHYNMYFWCPLRYSSFEYVSMYVLAPISDNESTEWVFARSPHKL
jgi:hypothetical protein